MIKFLIIAILFAGCGENMIVSPKVDKENIDILSTNVEDNSYTLTKALTMYVSRERLSENIDLDMSWKIEGSLLTIYTQPEESTSRAWHNSLIAEADKFIIEDQFGNKIIGQYISADSGNSAGFSDSFITVNLISIDDKIQFTQDGLVKKGLKKNSNWRWWREADITNTASIEPNMPHNDINGINIQLSDAIYNISNTIAPYYYRKFYKVGSVVSKFYPDDGGRIRFFEKIKNDGWDSDLAKYHLIEKNYAMGALYVCGEPHLSEPHNISMLLTSDIDCTGSQALGIYERYIWDSDNIPFGASSSAQSSYILKVGSNYYEYLESENIAFKNGRADNDFFKGRDLSDIDYWKEVDNNIGWAKVDELNKNKPFDGINNTFATEAGTATYSLKVNKKFDSVSFGGILADTVQVVFKNSAGAVQSDKIVAINNNVDDSGNFDGAPVTEIVYNNANAGENPTVIDAGGTVDITITGAKIQIGSIQPQLSIDIGITLIDFDIEFTDLSPMKIGKGGEVDYISGIMIRDITATIMFETSKFDKLVNMLMYIKKTPTTFDFGDSLNSAPDAENKIFNSTKIIGYIDKAKPKALTTDNKDHYKDYSQLDITVREIG